MIEIIGLRKSFNSHEVLTGINLKIEKGQTKVIIGRSGCGKSVLLKHIVGILRPEAGKVIVDGQDITGLSGREMHAVRMKIAMVFQGGALFDSLSVGENVGFGLLEHTTIPKGEVKKRVEEALSHVGLSGIEDKMPAELSGGMKKRVALARAICIRPQIILYDEPTTGVDPITADSINELIRSLHDKIKVTAVAVTHDMKSAYRIADRIAMLYQGKIIVEGSPGEIQDSHNPVVHQFINGLASGPITENAHAFD